MRSLALTLAAPLLAALFVVPGALAQSGDGQVQISLEQYTELLAQAATGDPSAPAGYAYSGASADVDVDSEGRFADVSMTFTIDILRNDWVVVPILPPGVAVTSGTVAGNTMTLVPTQSGLAWIADSRGSYPVSLQYQVAVEQIGDGGSMIRLPLAPVTSTALTMVLPGSDLRASVIPATVVTQTPTGASTIVEAMVPSTTGAQITWQGATEEIVTVSRALYQGVVDEDSVTWNASFSVSLSGDGPVTYDLLDSAGVALLGITVDGDEAPITVHGSAFRIALRGAGDHQIEAEFQVPVDRSTGQPVVRINTPRVPVSRFELTVEGEKEVSVSPRANVSHENDGTFTTASVNVPMAAQVTFSWLEAVPEADVAETEVRATATIHHTAHAEEGVLYVHATTLFDVTRGETSQFVFTLPENALINSVQTQTGAVADWRRAPDDPTRVLLFLDRRVSGELRLDIDYERIFDASSAETEAFDVPLIEAQDVHRQRGMVALLSSRDLTLTPGTIDGLSRVGANQLPAFVRENITLTIAHAFRYFESGPSLTVTAAPPVRQQGRFDAQIDTLVSLGDVTTLGQVSVEVNIKQGGIDVLDLWLPPEVNFLNLTAPSLRERRVEAIDGGQRIHLEFTQEMEGQFRVDVTYEKITGDMGPELSIPLLHVENAEVEQGRVAIEALSAVEVQVASQSESLSTVDISELPQQLILRTTNPILLAFKYAQADPPPALGLTITQHTEVEVQAATIDSALYRTLYTADGFALTTCTFVVRNSREQFLRVRLPEGSEVWSAMVNGEAETPALASGDGTVVLINIINSAQGFPVELIYATPQPELAFRGHVESTLPRPDMVVTHTRWDLFLPDDLRYGEPDSPLDLLEEGVPVYGEDFGVDAARGQSNTLDEQIRIVVPEAGVRFSFEKLYANQVEGEMTVRIPYATAQSADWGIGLSLAGTVLFWLGLLILATRKHAVVGVVVTAAGAGMAAAALSMLDAQPDRMVQVSGLMMILLFSFVVYTRLSAKLQARRSPAAGGSDDNEG